MDGADEPVITITRPILISGWMAVCQYLFTGTAECESTCLP